MADTRPIPADRSLLALELWDKRMRAAISPLLTKQVISEHRHDPLGHHSDTLKRVLNYFRRSTALTPYAVICTRPFEQWRIARLSGLRAVGPTFIDERTFTSEAEAVHALFLLRVDEAMRA
jgi:branched-chain amino acid transport system permease protein